MTLSKQQVLEWLLRCAEVFIRERDVLTQLDTEIGDGDHGLNMSRGFNKVVEKLPAVADQDIGTILKNTGMTLLSSVGGASGPLFGTFFIRAAQAANAKQSLELAELQQMIQEGVAGVAMRGKAEPGDKTLCDVWWPVLESLDQSVQQQRGLPQALQQAAVRAEQAALATIPMQARKGRASYLGERSIGHQDPGATSVMLMMKTLAAVAEKAG
ncbi:dihydroxyacetone kinase subunit DhaL [Serratia oryzae]|uniref:dihydroxyacetone kinase subunit DhaL n=1 Tax=Serratia oryzae TaxID=2034155 RepID=UPI0012E202DE|nr:dihydroxyacetone kinase subunit DhaL [Serratia oryzae]